MDGTLRILACVALFAAAGPTNPASALSDEPGLSAGEVIERAERDARAGRFAKAIEGYRAAFDMTGDPLHHYNVSVIYLSGMDRPLDAWEYAARFEEEATSDADREDAAKWMARVERRLASNYGKLNLTVVPPEAVVWLDRRSDRTLVKHGAVWTAAGYHEVLGEAEGYEPGMKRVRVEKGTIVEVRLELAALSASLHITCDRPGSMLTFDGAQAGCPVTLAGLEPGRHVVTAKAEGAATYETELSLAPGENRTLEIELGAGLPPEPAVEAAEVPDPRRPWVWASIGTGSAFVAAGTVLYALARTELDFDSTKVSSGEYDRRVRRGKALGYSSYAFWGVGAAALTAGLVLYFTRPEDSGAAIHPASLDGPGVAATVRF